LRTLFHHDRDQNIKTFLDAGSPPSRHDRRLKRSASHAAPLAAPAVLQHDADEAQDAQQDFGSEQANVVRRWAVDTSPWIRANVAAPMTDARRYNPPSSRSVDIRQATSCTAKPSGNPPNPTGTTVIPVGEATDDEQNAQTLAIRQRNADRYFPGTSIIFSLAFFVASFGFAVAPANHRSTC
jgi:hypothetical protein